MAKIRDLFEEREEPAARPAKKSADSQTYTAKDIEVLEKYRGELRKWAEDPQRSRVVSLDLVESSLERAAWAEQAKSPLRKTLTPWTKSFFFKQPDDAFVKHLETVRDKYAPRDAVPDAAALSRLVRGLAKDILATPRVGEKKTPAQK